MDDVRKKIRNLQKNIKQVGSAAVGGEPSLNEIPQNILKDLDLEENQYN